MSDIETLLRQVDTKSEELIDLVQSLVRIQSVNTGAMPTGNETPVCQYPAHDSRLEISILPP